MRIYSLEQEGLIFLSPYTQVSVQSDRLVIYQTLFNQTAVLHCSGAVSESLLAMLQQGVTDQALCRFLEESGLRNTEEILEAWLQIGVLE